MNTEGPRYRTAPQQEWMWRHAGEDRSSLWSVRTVALPEIDGARLANAFAALQSEYEILRSSIELTDAGQLAQSVAAQAKIAHALIDARGDTSIGEAWLSEGMLPDPRECASVLTLYKTDGANYMRAATSKLLLELDLLRASHRKIARTVRRGCN